MFGNKPQEAVNRETFGFVNLSHPFRKYYLSDAVSLAVNTAAVKNKRVANLEEAREVVRDAFQNCSIEWSVGATALDVFDAAIERRDLTRYSRITPTYN